MRLHYAVSVSSTTEVVVSFNQALHHRGGDFYLYKNKWDEVISKRADPGIHTLTEEDTKLLTQLVHAMFNDEAGIEFIHVKPYTLALVKSEAVSVGDIIDRVQGACEEAGERPLMVQPAILSQSAGKRILGYSRLMFISWLACLVTTGCIWVAYSLWTNPVHPPHYLATQVLGTILITGIAMGFIVAPIATWQGDRRQRSNGAKVARSRAVTDATIVSLKERPSSSQSA